MRKDKRGNIWVGTTRKGGAGICSCEKRFQKLEDFLRSAGGDKRREGGFIRAIEEDQEGKIWIAAPGQGLHMYDPSSNTFHLYGPKNVNNLPIDEVQCLLIGEDGVLWGGTSSRGLGQFDFKKDNFRIFSARDGLANEVIWKILKDRSGKLWISTNKGLSFWDPLQAGF